MSFDDLQKYIRDVTESANADIFLVSGDIKYGLDRNILRSIKQNKSNENVIVILSTFGGDADIAYRIARFFQEFYTSGNFSVYVPDICKSAGTLIVLGADEIIMSRDAQLGPLDVQLGKPDEIGKSISGLTPVQSLEFLQKRTFELFEHYFIELIRRSGSQITTKTSMEIATRLTSGLFQPIYSQLDPMRLGEYQRNMQVAEEYGQRLDSGNLKQGSLHRLINEYPSHGFVIDRKEAEQLFNNVKCPSDTEENMVSELTEVIVAGLLGDEPEVYYLEPKDLSNTKEKSDEKTTNEVVNKDDDEFTHEQPQEG